MDDSEPIVAVFPFQNRSGDPDLDWLGHGLAWSLTDKFHRVSALQTADPARVRAALAEAGAARAFKGALRIDPENADAHYNLGVIYKETGRDDEAVALLKEAVRINPSHADAHFNLGAAYNALKRYDQAVAAFKKAIQLNPNYADLYFNLGIAHTEAGRYDEALLLRLPDVVTTFGLVLLLLDLNQRVHLDGAGDDLPSAGGPKHLNLVHAVGVSQPEVEWIEALRKVARLSVVHLGVGLRTGPDHHPGAQAAPVGSRADQFHLQVTDGLFFRQIADEHHRLGIEVVGHDIQVAVVV